MGVKLVLTAIYGYLKVDPLPQAKHLMLMKSPDFSQRFSSRTYSAAKASQVKDLMVDQPPPQSIHLAFTVLFCL